MWTLVLRFSGEFDNEKVSQKRTDRDFTKKRRARLPASRLLSQILVVLLFLSIYSLLRVFNKSFIITTKILIFSEEERRTTICLSWSENSENFWIEDNLRDLSKQVFLSMFKVPQTIILVHPVLHLLYFTTLERPLSCRIDLQHYCSFFSTFHATTYYSL